jgi:hypothetical protein
MVVGRWVADIVGESFWRLIFDICKTVKIERRLRAFKLLLREDLGRKRVVEYSARRAIWILWKPAREAVSWRQ